MEMIFYEEKGLREEKEGNWLIEWWACWVNNENFLIDFWLMQNFKAFCYSEHFMLLFRVMASQECSIVREDNIKVWWGERWGIIAISLANRCIQVRIQQKGREREEWKGKPEAVTSQQRRRLSLKAYFPLCLLLPPRAIMFEQRFSIFASFINCLTSSSCDYLLYCYSVLYL